MPGELVSESDAETVAIYAVLVYGIVSATCSSPQTAEINADKRAATLMKWVWLGLAQSALFGLLGAMLDKRRWPPLLGSGMAAGMLLAQYKHALRAGLASGAGGTET